jgi:NRPS condensation-like uncharacterized protein
MDWQTWYQKTDSVPFDFAKGPLARFCIITGENTEIIIVGHHLLGDGIGYLNVVKDVLRALDNNIDTTPQIPPAEPADRYFKETVLLDAPTKAYAKALNEEWRANRVRFSEEAYAAFFKEYRKKYAPALFMASLEGDDVKKVLKKSKINGLTVNEILAAAFSGALMEKLGKKELRLGIAANIRNELVSEPNDCMGNYVTGISATIHSDPAGSFIAYAKAIAALVREQLGNVKNRHLVVHFLNEFDKDLIEATMPAAYGTFDHPAAKKLAELIGEQAENKGLGLSNLGRHAVSDYEHIAVMDIQFIGPAFPANLVTMGVITVHDKLNVCLRYNEGELSASVIKEIYEKATALLAARV